jgi:hypothetical protein
LCFNASTTIRLLPNPVKGNTVEDDDIGKLSCINAIETIEVLVLQWEPLAIQMVLIEVEGGIKLLWTGKFLQQYLAPYL